MASQRSAFRILMNVALDGALAAVAAVVARWVADPGGGLLHPLWFLGGGAITLLVGGLPFHLSQQYWRFSAVEDLVGVAGGSVVSAALFALVWTVTGYPLPTPTFPIVHALTLAAFLGAPRVFYRLAKARPAAPRAARCRRCCWWAPGRARTASCAPWPGSGGPGCAWPGCWRSAATRPAGGCRGMPSWAACPNCGACWTGWRGRDRLPDALVVTEPRLAGSRMAYLLEEAQRQGIPVRQAPRPTELREAAGIELKPVALEDLLNRPQVRLDRDGMERLVRGRRVLVTGAGGTIGSELARQVAALGPAALTLLDNGEYRAVADRPGTGGEPPRPAPPRRDRRRAGRGAAAARPSPLPGRTWCSTPPR